MEPKKLYRSTRDRKISGVCGGLGDYLNMDPTVIRILFVVFSLTVGFGLLAYIIMSFIIPSEYDVKHY